jgi:phospholipase C
LKYELYVDGNVTDDGKDFVIRFKSGKEIFREESLGAPFNVYAPGNFWNKERQAFEPVKTWAFAVKAGDAIEYRWPLSSFEGGVYHLRVYGPNGFFREFIGDSASRVEVSCQPVKKRKGVTGQLKISVNNRGSQTLRLQRVDDKYQNMKKDFVLSSGAMESFTLETAAVQGWYNFIVRADGAENIQVHYAGRLETGADGISDPYMGRVGV